MFQKLMDNKTFKTSEIKAHAKFSASGSPRWINCPGSIKLSEKAPESPESVYAKEGTDAHACLEILLKHSEKAPESPESVYAKEGTDAHACLEIVLKHRKKWQKGLKLAKEKYPEEMVSYAEEAVYWIEKKLKDFNAAEVLCETRIDSSPFTCEGQFGTLDAAIVEEYGRLVVIDYKYGAGISVDPDDNAQLIYYALGISHQYHHNFQEVELVIIQPRAYHESGETIRTWTCSMDYLLSWEEKFKEGVKEAREENARLQAGKWCKFCPAAPICPAIKNQALERARIVFDDEKGLLSAPDPKSIAIRDLPTILKATYDLEKWIAEVQKHAYFVLSRGEKIEGFKLVESRATRIWSNKTEASLDAELYLGYDAFSKPELLSPAQIEKKFSGVLNAEKFIEQFIEKHVVKKSSGLVLAPESDRRQAVDKLASVFPELPDPGKEVTVDA